VEVCRVGDLEDGVPKIVSLDRRRVVVVRCSDEIFAIRDVCPHMTSSFAAGIVRPVVAAAPDSGEIVLNVDEPMVRCPWHAWEFNMRTGECLVDPKLRVRAYDVTVRDSVVYIELGR
jgi:nitrite reductase/ring-hydroxylating ferredoxin subunit